MSEAKIHDVRYRPYDGEVSGSSRRAIVSIVSTKVCGPCVCVW